MDFFGVTKTSEASSRPSSLAHCQALLPRQATTCSFPGRAIGHATSRRYGNGSKKKKNRSSKSLQCLQNQSKYVGYVIKIALHIYIAPLKGLKTRGPDAWSKVDLKMLPSCMREELANMYTCIENGASWPRQIVRGHVTCLEKN